MVNAISYRLPQMIIAAAIIGIGLYILADKKKKLDQEEAAEEDEHYWEPYRPYQQPTSPEDTETAKPYASAAQIPSDLAEDASETDTAKSSSSDTTIS